MPFFSPRETYEALRSKILAIYSNEALRSGRLNQKGNPLSGLYQIINVLYVKKENQTTIENEFSEEVLRDNHYLYLAYLASHLKSNATSKEACVKHGARVAYFLGRLLSEGLLIPGTAFQEQLNMKFQKEVAQLVEQDPEYAKRELTQEAVNPCKKYTGLIREKLKNREVAFKKKLEEMVKRTEHRTLTPSLFTAEFEELVCKYLVEAKGWIESERAMDQPMLAAQLSFWVAKNKLTDKLAYYFSSAAYYFSVVFEELGESTEVTTLFLRASIKQAINGFIASDAENALRMYSEHKSQDHTSDMKVPPVYLSILGEQLESIPSSIPVSVINMGLFNRRTAMPHVTKATATPTLS